MEPQGTDNAEIGGTILSFVVAYGVWVVLLFLVLFAFVSLGLWMSGKKPKAAGRS